MNNNELNIIDQQFVDYWKSLDFTKWNENDVREDFISPLLKILGYAKDTVNEIIREKTLNLSESYHRIGRKQVAIDYVPTVRLQKFWIIEAKPGNSKEMSFGDFLQAHLYAIHPEIQAKFIVLTNGWEIRVYDSLFSKAWDDFIYLCTKENCQKTFGQLKTLLSAKQISKSIRTQILLSLKSSLTVELDEDEVEDLKRDFNKIYYETLPIIRKNARDFQCEQFRKREQKDAEEIRKLSFDELCYLIDRPINGAPIVGWWVYGKIKESSADCRKEMLAKLAMKWRGRPHSVFKVQCVNILVRLIEENIEIEGTPAYISSISNGLDELVSFNMKYWAWDVGEKIDHIGFALSHLDNTCARFSYKLSRRIAMDSLIKIVESKKQSLSIEDLLTERPTVAGEMIGIVEKLYDFLWYRFNGGDSKKIWDVIWHIEFIEENFIDKIPEPQYPNNDFDLLNFQHYGKGMDMLCIGTWSILNMRSKQLESKTLPDSVKLLMNKTREQIKDEIPKPIEKSIDWKPTDQSIMNIFNSINVNK